MYVKMARIHLFKKCYDFGIGEDNSIKIYYNNFKASNYVM